MGSLRRISQLAPAEIGDVFLVSTIEMFSTGIGPPLDRLFYVVDKFSISKIIAYASGQNLKCLLIGPFFIGR